MPGLTGRGTTYNLPNYHGELFSLTPSDTPVLSSIGGLTGGKAATKATETEWQARDLRTPGALRQRLEGADAPTAESRSRLNLTNVLEIHQEAVDISYTKLAATQNYAGANIGGSDNPVTNEVAEQIQNMIKSKALDIEHSFINGKYQKPNDNTTARRTRGLIQAITTGINNKSNVLANGGSVTTGVDITIANDRFTKATHGYSNGDEMVVVGGEAAGFYDHEVYYVVGQSSGYFSLAAKSGGTAITPLADVSGVSVYKTGTVTGDNVIDLLQTVWENGGIRESETATLIVGAAQKRLLTKAFITDKGYAESTRTVGGVHVQTIETDFGVLNIMLSRRVPKSALVVASLEQLAPVLLETPGKGVFFVEPLAKTGAADRSQLYGEIGLEYGNPLAHGVITGAKVA